MEHVEYAAVVFLRLCSELLRETPGHIAAPTVACA